MKDTDYAPRAAFMDTFLTGQNLTGAEIGCDVGAHAEAILKYCDIKQLYLVDLWLKEYYRGYCEGRLHSAGFKNNVLLFQSSSEQASIFINAPFDFIYIDISHEYETVKTSLEDWWPKLIKNGLLGYRNYSEANMELKRAVDEFVLKHNIKTQVSTYHNEIVLFK